MGRARRSCDLRWFTCSTYSLQGKPPEGFTKILFEKEVLPLFSGAVVKALYPPGFNFVLALPKTESSHTTLIQLPRHQDPPLRSPPNHGPSLTGRPAWKEILHTHPDPFPPKRCLASLTVRKFLLESNPHPSSCRPTYAYHVFHIRNSYLVSFGFPDPYVKSLPCLYIQIPFFVITWLSSKSQKIEPTFQFYVKHCWRETYVWVDSSKCYSRNMVS